METLLDHARPVDGGLAWPDVPSRADADPTLYSGGAGIVVALVEGHRHTGDQRYRDAAERGADLLETALAEEDSAALHFGATGVAVALAAAGRSPAPALDRVRRMRDGQWSTDPAELMGGNAGIALGALACGEPDLAETAVEPDLHAAEPTADGVQWEVRAGQTGRPHHISHGTLGIVMAVGAVAEVTGRADLLELARAGAADVVGRNTAGPDGFLVPHSDPPYKPHLNPRWAYGRRRHGPAGDAQVFRAARTQVTGDASGTALGTAAGNDHHDIRAAAAVAARLLGQQRTLLRHCRGARAGLRPHRGAGRRSGVRRDVGGRPGGPRRPRAVVQP